MSLRILSVAAHFACNANRTKTVLFAGKNELLQKSCRFMSWVLGWVGYLIEEHLFATYMFLLLSFKISSRRKSDLINIKGLEPKGNTCLGVCPGDPLRGKLRAKG